MPSWDFSRSFWTAGFAIMAKLWVRNYLTYWRRQTKCVWTMLYTYQTNVSICQGSNTHTGLNNEYFIIIFTIIVESMLKYSVRIHAKSRGLEDILFVTFFRHWKEIIMLLSSFISGRYLPLLYAFQWRPKTGHHWSLPTHYALSFLTFRLLLFSTRQVPFQLAELLRDCRRYRHLLHYL